MPTARTPVSLDERTAALADRVQAAVARGMSIEEEAETTAIVVAGRPLNHALHFVVSLLGGVWLIGWLVLAFRGGERRELLTVDEHGIVTSRNVNRDSVIFDRLFKLLMGGKYKTHVQAPPDEVFASIVRLQFLEHSGWFGSSTVHGLEGRPVQLGSVFWITGSNEHGTHAAEFEVIELVPDRKLVCAGRRGGIQGRRRLTFTVEPEDGGSRVGLANELRRFAETRLHPIVTLLALVIGTLSTLLPVTLIFGLFMLPFVWPAMKWDVRTVVRRIKRQVEQHTEAP